MKLEQLSPLSRRAFLVGADCLLSSAARSGRKVRAAMHAALTVLDPFGPPTYITRNYGYLVFDTLFALDADNEPRPQIVQTWRVSEDGLHYGFTQVMENVPLDMVAMLRRTRGLTLKPRRFGNSLFLRFNGAQAPFDDPKVRRAVMAAIRQTDCLDAQVGDTALEQPWVAEVPGPGGDPVRARALLAASGYAGEAVVILHPADIPALSAIGPITEQMLRDIGMTVRLDAMDWRSMLARRAQPAGVGGWVERSDHHPEQSRPDEPGGEPASRCQRGPGVTPDGRAIRQWRHCAMCSRSRTTEPGSKR